MFGYFNGNRKNLYSFALGIIVAGSSLITFYGIFLVNFNNDLILKFLLFVVI